MAPARALAAREAEERQQAELEFALELVERGRLEFDERWIGPEKRAQIEDAAKRLGTARMKSIKDALPEEISYGEIRLVAAALGRAESAGQTSSG